MKDIVFSTGNADKLLTAVAVCSRYDIRVIQKDLAITEIQEENPELVALDKAKKAYDAINGPVIISDDAWSFTGLKGFPGVYMHSMNEWFRPEDFLHLTLPLENREVVLTKHLVYMDESEQKLFMRQTKGILLHEIRGHSRHGSHSIISLDGDNGLSIAEVFDSTADKSDRQASDVWHDFARWFVTEKNIANF